jgi:multidrug efflux pump
MANKLINAANKRPELKNVKTTIKTDYPVYHATIDRDKARSLGIPISNITEAMQSTFGQLFVNQFTMLNRNYQVNMESGFQFRQRPDDLSKVFVRAASGRLVPLSSVVSMHRKQAPNFVSRFDVHSAAKILGNHAPGYSSGQALAAMQQVAHKVLPRNYQLGWTGASYQQQKVGTASRLAFGFGIIMVFLILVAQYERWSLPLAVLTAVPFALFGAAGFTLVRGLQSDVYFQIGLLVLIGLAAKNAILIVEYAVQLRDSEDKSIIEAGMTAARLRFRPIVMTSLAFIMGTLPLAVATGASSASRHSIGTAVIGGMLGATILAIFFVPLFYVLIARAQEWLARKRGKSTEEE